MTKALAFWYPGVVVLLLALLTSGHASTPSVTFRSPDELEAPVCDNVYPGSLIACYLIDDTSMSVLDEAFASAAEANWTEVHLVLISCDVDRFPDDAFVALEVELVSLSFNVNCTMSVIPNRILAQIESPLRELQFIGVETIETIGSQDFANLLFSASLEVLVFQLDRLATIEASPFQGFVNLKELTITSTAVSQLRADLLTGLGVLVEVTITYNANLYTLPSQFFVQQAYLQDIWLGSNHLWFLDESALDGLASVQMLSVAGNPFYCNCSLEWFKDWLVEEDLVEASGAACQYPISAPFNSIDFCSGEELRLFDKIDLTGDIEMNDE